MISPALGALEPSEEEVIFRRAAYQMEWIAHVLINLDFPVIVRQPDELRELIRQLGAKAMQISAARLYDYTAASPPNRRSKHK